MKPVDVARRAGSFIGAVSLAFERREDGRVQRATIFGFIPVFDRQWFPRMRAADEAAERAKCASKKP